MGYHVLLPSATYKKRFCSSKYLVSFSQDVCINACNVVIAIVQCK